MLIINVLAAGAILHGGVQTSPVDVFAAKIEFYCPCLTQSEVVGIMLRAKSPARRRRLWNEFKFQYGFYGTIGKKAIKDIEQTGIDSGFLQ